MELHELEVLEDGPCAVCHSDSVACRLRWVSGFAVELASTACGEDGILRPDDLGFLLLVLGDDSDAVIVIICDEVYGVEVGDDFYVWFGLDFFDQSLCDDPAGLVTMAMDDSWVRMASFEGRRDFVIFFIEVGVPIDEFVDEFGGLSYDEFYGGFIVEVTAGVEGVFYVRFEGVIFFDYASDAALRFPGV